MIKLTAHILDDSGFVFPSDENKINGNCSGDDAKSNRCKIENYFVVHYILVITCLLGGNNHGDHGDEDGAEDVDNWEDEVDPDGPLPVGLFPPQPGNAKHGETD